MPRGVALLTFMLLVGCSSAPRSVLPATGQTRYCVYVPSSGFVQAERGGASAAVPAPGEPHRTENVVRAVAKDNPRGRRFHDAATIRWGELHRYTGY